MRQFIVGLLFSSIVSPAVFAQGPARGAGTITTPDFSSYQAKAFTLCWRQFVGQSATIRRSGSVNILAGSREVSREAETA